jgi:regulator of protease activity HflC (stomatin/prohibitin superfamily)
MLNKVKISKICAYFILALLIIASLAYSCLQVVPEANQGILLQKNRLVWLAPGAHFTLPFSKVTLIPLNQQTSIVTLNNNDGSSSNITVLWQVHDAEKFWQATNNDGNKVNALFKTALTSAGKTMDITQNAAIMAAGISVNQPLLTGQNLTDAQLQATYQKMQGLATTIAQGIINDGSKNAEAIRAQGEQALIDTEGQAAAQAAQVIGAGQAQAVQINAPLYHKNPELFKLLVDTKAKMLQQ